jgi:uroporphyrinogen-III decarboxylase
MELICDILKPDAVISHDDWGAKTGLFISPELWRRYIKPCYAKIYGYLKKRGVIILHHADSFLEPIVEDMAELGVDVWQGVLPQNDVPKLQKQLAGRMALMGGIDSAVVDRADSSESEIRAETRRVCEEYAPRGHFIPCVTYGGPRTLRPEVYGIIDDEIDLYNKKHFLNISK